MFSSPRWYLLGDVLKVVTADYQRAIERTPEDILAKAQQDAFISRFGKPTQTYSTGDYLSDLSNFGGRRKCRCCPNCGGIR